MANSFASMLKTACALALCSTFLPFSAAHAQVATTSREVVQALPSKEVERLNRALIQLAEEPSSVSVLLEAGNASLGLGDLDAAMGFFGRAGDLAPENADVKLGMAVVFLRSDRPIEALRLFAEAEREGANPRDVIAERALAYDLVGNSVEAQEAYRAALALNDDPETRRRLGISYAISGKRDLFEATLLPLLEKRDFAAYRARAFGLAILGNQREAAEITTAVMPRDLSERIIPFLEFMPRLTKAQQAAAANLGIFPRAAEIGRDDPRITRFAKQGSDITAAAETRMAPAGEPLGAPVQPKRPNLVEPSAPSLSDAFADLSGDAPLASARQGGVNLAKIDIPREVAEPDPPAHPSRQWVQVATGQDRSRLRFDWRRVARQAGDILEPFKPHVVGWGETNRLLAGPIETRREARALVNALKEQGLDTFTYTSPEGEEIQELK